MGPRILLTGCSGGGKSTLIDELARRGFQTVAEPGRRIVRAALAGGTDALPGAVLPWEEPVAFAEQALALAIADFDAAAGEGPIFFDRGMIDAAAALERATGVPAAASLAERAGGRRYARRVILAPPWPELYATDAERRGGMAEALVEYAHLEALLPRLGYAVLPLPKTGVAERADFLLSA